MNNLTRFFMPDEPPVRTGTYQAIIDFQVPHPKHRDEIQIYANWNGQEWRGFNGKKVKIQAWRGLTTDPMQTLADADESLGLTT